jgi:ecotin
LTPLIGIHTLQYQHAGADGGHAYGVYPNAQKVNRFVTLGGEPYLIRYYSRLPIVVYAPEGVEERYLVWSAGPESRVIE